MTMGCFAVQLGNGQSEERSVLAAASGDHCMGQHNDTTRTRHTVRTQKIDKSSTPEVTLEYLQHCVMALLT